MEDGPERKHVQGYMKEAKTFMLHMEKTTAHKYLVSQSQSTQYSTLAKSADSENSLSPTINSHLLTVTMAHLLILPQSYCDLNEATCLQLMLFNFY